MLILYAISYTVPLLTVFGIIQLGWALYLVPAYMFLVHPLVDYFTANIDIKPQKNSPYQDALIWMYIPILFSIILFGLERFCFFDLNLFQKIALIFCVGASSGSVGIAMAHEMIHRKSTVERMGGMTLLSLSLFQHYRIEHVFGHHTNVATFDDPATARKNESIYLFWMRSLLTGYVLSWKIANKKSFLKNRMIGYTLIQLVTLFALFYFYSIAGLVFFCAQALLAIILLISGDYIEHYGCLRERLPEGKLESIKAKHSWDASHLFTNIHMYNLGKHADHHLHPLKQYPELKLQEGALRMPYGYSSMMLIALVPPLWKKLINPYIDLQN
jgi:alkane 1-monooxygenase